MNCTLMHLKSKTRKIFGFRSAYVAVLDVLPSTSGAPGAARTRNLLIRSQALCPIELRGRTNQFYRKMIVTKTTARVHTPRAVVISTGEKRLL